MGGRGGSSGLNKSGKTFDVKSLPALTGSEKQIEWASNIRKIALETVNANIKLAEERLRKYKGDPLFEEDLESYKEVGNQLIQIFQKFTKASDIIDKRNVLSSSKIVKTADDIRMYKKRKKM